MVKEGRNRLVRRLWESQDVIVSRLIRIRFGIITIPRDLRRGRWTELTPADRRAVRAAAKDSVPYMRSKLDAYEVSARLMAENAGSQVIDNVDRKSFADVLRPLYPKLLPNLRLQEMAREAQAEVGVASVP